ncbi:unnamed protein product [Rotaria sordida]|uniref:Uncharacterized protein n=1 Tax=Rotaria sordida TaxID=392033 RepID=A0A813V037_9BILA|nr:unnamed protein product [Rotaria sordida]CAF3566541.1 unnamed protein product [Rotaria sordida]
MDNVVLTSASQISPKSGSPLNSQPIPSVTVESITTSTIESLVEIPLESVEQTNIDGNFQARLDVNYQAHDVALATAKTNGHEQINGLKFEQHHKMDIDDGYEHPDKMKSCCIMLNKLFLALAIVCFALFLCAIAFIVTNRGVAYSNPNVNNVFGISDTYDTQESLTSSDQLINDTYFNLTHRYTGGIIVVLSRRGASINDILIPYTDSNGIKQYRSIIVKGTRYGSIRFDFDKENDSINLNNQLPLNYPFLNYYNDDWLMYGDKNNPYHIRFVNDLIEIIYEFSSSNMNEFMMTTIVSPKLHEQIVADPTNNIYFNLRGYGNLSTHYLNLSSSTPIHIETTEQMQKNQLIEGQYVDQLTDINNYFYKLDRVGIGKNFIATLMENETKTKLNIFADHSGITIDPFIVGSSDRNITIPDMYGIRISPRQSPVFQTMSIYGPTIVVYPSQAIHTTWWQFEY